MLHSQAASADEEHPEQQNNMQTATKMVCARGYSEMYVRTCIDVEIV